jgi:hypothetical protein
MTAEPNSITTLKKFYGDRLHVADRQSLIAEIMGGNDRSAVITVASHADAALEFLIVTNLPGLPRDATEKDVDHVFRHEGPLGTFSARIDLAFYLGLIDAQLRETLHDLRAMRNAVAHTKRRVTFEDAALQNVAKRLLAPNGYHKLSENSVDGIRRTFLAEGLLIVTILTHGRDEALRLARKGFMEAGREPPF